MYRNRPFWVSRLRHLSLISLALTFVSCGAGNTREAKVPPLFARNNLIAWCIVPFDAKGRNPEERALMLQELGFTKMAWDWRMEHIDMLGEEIRALQSHNIELSAVWLWIDQDVSDGFPAHLEKIFQTIESSGVKTTFWVSFPGSFFDLPADEAKMARAISTISAVNDRALMIGCKVGLYNHMDWFGEPENQIRIIQAIGSENVGIVYNFHHGHHQVDDFPVLLEMMMPYLFTINLNGMVKEGPKILDIGSGLEEAVMIKTIIDSGFSGTIGIIGHTEGEDIRMVLNRNLEGLDSLLTNIVH